MTINANQRGLNAALDLNDAHGKRDVYIVFKDNWGVGNFDWFKFKVKKILNFGGKEVQV